LALGAWRLELLDLKAPPTLGSSVPIVLHFERAGQITVPADVVDATARQVR
jgi:copper(I)-binding protein